ncbi:MBG domain-containing protein [Polynucleobacter necessarius]|uniref:MBG domain-containing protein n=1 Tax=Polynucleobacter necessarius TaxID=576610 RepID=UPI000FE23F6A|nr:MBG domain-containing protein [Polynucleobacter necessarius]
MLQLLPWFTVPQFQVWPIPYSSGLVGGDTSATLAGSLTTNASNTANVGSSYVISQGNVAASGNYTIASYVPANVTITPAPLVITAANDSKVYGNLATSTNSVTYNSGGVVASAVVGYTSSGLLNGDVVNSVNLSSTGGLVTASVNNGLAYAITLSSATGVGLGNYTISYVAGQITITPRALTIAIDNKTMVYGASTLPVLTYSIAGQGLVNGDSTPVSLTTTARSFNGTAGSASPVANYPITATATSNPNYIITAPDDVLSITKANLIIAASNQTTTYGSPLVLSQQSALTATGLVNGDYVSTAVILSNASQTGQAGGQ